MDFKQLEAYINVIELASFSKAAKAIFLSQPSVSAYINALEKELGTFLINRSTKEVSPTLAGKIFYEKAKELLALKHNVTEGIKNLSGNLSGEIKLLASSVPSQYILPGLLARFHRLYPDISFTVRQADTLEVSKGIASQKAEIGFSGGITRDGKCEFKEFLTEKLVFIAPYSEELSGPGEYPLEKLLSEYRFISREKGSGTRTQYESYFAARKISLGKLDTYAVFDNTQSIINAVINGLGVSVVSELAARVYIEKKMLSSVNPGVPLPERKLYYVLKRSFSLSHLSELFIRFLDGEFPVVDQQ